MNFLRPWATACCVLLVSLISPGLLPTAAFASEPPLTNVASPTAAKWLISHSRAIPIVFYTPENHLGLGAGTLTSWVMPAAPDKRPSYLTLAAIYTTLRQTVLSARYELRGAAERFVLIQDLRYIDWPDRFYGVGNFTRVSNREDFVDRYLQADSEFYIRAWRRVFIGARYHLRFSDTRDVPEQPRWLDPKVLYGVGPLRWSGLGAIAMLDNRDSVFWPKRGQLAVAQVTMYRKWLGSQFNADRFRFEIRHFQRLSSRQILAIRGLAEFARGQVPFQLLPALGGSEIFRGWFLGRLRDKALLDLEVEWRQELGRRWAVTGFAAVGKVGDCVPAVVQNFPRAAIGAGIRFAIKPEDRAHVRLDISYGDATNLYLQFREAF